MVECKQGSKKACFELYRLYSKAMLNVAFRIVGSIGEAEDVLQTAYLKMIDGRAKFDGRSSLRTFLFAVIRNTAADSRRRSFVLRLFAPAPQPPPDASADRARIIGALQKLSPRQREVLELVWSDGSKVDRQLIDLKEMAPFGSRKFRVPFDASGKKWVRFAVWDSAGNGALTQPVHLK